MHRTFLSRLEFLVFILLVLWNVEFFEFSNGLGGLFLFQLGSFMWTTRHTVDTFDKSCFSYPLVHDGCLLWQEVSALDLCVYLFSAFEAAWRLAGHRRLCEFRDQECNVLDSGMQFINQTICKHQVSLLSLRLLQALNKLNISLPFDNRLDLLGVEELLELFGNLLILTQLLLYYACANGGYFVFNVVLELYKVLLGLLSLFVSLHFCFL